MEASLVVPGIPRLHALAGGGEGAVGGIDGIEEAAGVVPLVKSDEVDVLQLLGFEAGQGLQVFAWGGDGLRRFLGAAFAGCIDLLFHVLHVEEELVRGAGTDGASAIHPELLEIPSPGSYFRDVRGPDSIRARLKAANLTATIENGFGAGSRFVGDGALGGAGVGEVKLYGAGEIIFAFREVNGDRLIGSGGLELAHGQAGAIERSKRPIGLGGIGRGELARPLVIAVGGDVERGGGKGGGQTAEQGCQHETE